jgi:hypothetical protein
MKIVSPANQSTIVGNTPVPVLIQFSDAGYSNFSTSLDGIDRTDSFALAYEQATASFTLAPGSHTLIASADVYDKLYQHNIGHNISSTFSSAAPTLTVVTVNVANAFALGNITWEMKMDRLSEQIVASREVPDIISMTESSGWTWCSTPASDNSGDYDMVDRLIWRLRDRIGVTYRVAYMVGAEGAFGWGRCHYYSGDTVLYNPNRITNLTPNDVAAKPQVAHNDNLLGFLVRRSLPICNRGARTNIPNLEQLIDGPAQVDKCNRATPSAPVWAWQAQNPDGRYAVVATLARFGLVSVPDSSFDVVTTHPTFLQELLHQAPISDFIAALTGPGYRNTRPYYPTIVLGDFNCLAGVTLDPPYDECLPKESPKPAGSWPAGTTLVFTAPEDVMGVALASTAGPLPPFRTLTMAVGATLPARQPCRPPKEEREATGMHYFADRSFSDHCGLLVRFSE